MFWDIIVAIQNGGVREIHCSKKANFLIFFLIYSIKTHLSSGNTHIMEQKGKKSHFEIYRIHNLGHCKHTGISHKFLVFSNISVNNVKQHHSIIKKSNY